jgi:eukaryotic-like serine/threonine-protein kinase
MNQKQPPLITPEPGGQSSQGSDAGAPIHRLPLLEPAAVIPTAVGAWQCGTAGPVQTPEEATLLRRLLVGIGATVGHGTYSPSNASDGHPSETPDPANEPTRDQSPSDLDRQLAQSIPDHPQFAPGQTVPNADLWILEEKLGAGGFGEVWLAKHRATNELRAVKFCTHTTARDRLFSHESKIALHVRKHMSTPDGCHPNIVPLLDCNLDGNPPWLMYEYVPGGRTLVDVIHELATVPATERIARAIQLMHIVAGAVGRFHRINVPIVHRDLKHKNVLMDGETPRIADFGIGGAAVLAEVADATPAHTDITVGLPSMLRASGTPPHASPQQVRGEPPHPRDDVYALGVMAYQLLVGRANAEVKGNWQRRLKDDGVPEALIELIGNSASEELSDRPKDAAEWEAALASLRGEVGVPATTRRVKVLVPGMWLARAARTEEEWISAGFTPGEITFQSDREYQFVVHEAVTDRDFEGIRVLAGVEPFIDLSLQSCANLTDAGLTHLKSLTSLQSLDLAHCRQVTDAGLAHLKDLTSLQSLNLSSCRQVTSIGLAHLKSLTSLQSLNLAHCRQVTDTGLARLKDLISLQSLDLAHCYQVTDAGLAYLKNLTSLQSLNLAHCRQVTDTGLARLKSLTLLQTLDLYFCHQVTNAGVKRLKEVLPNCEINL